MTVEELIAALTGHDRTLDVFFVTDVDNLHSVNFVTPDHIYPEGDIIVLEAMSNGD